MNVIAALCMQRAHSAGVARDLYMVPSADSRKLKTCELEKFREAPYMWHHSWNPDFVKKNSVKSGVGKRGDINWCGSCSLVSEGLGIREWQVEEVVQNIIESANELKGFCKRPRGRGGAGRGRKMKG